MKKLIAVVLLVTVIGLLTACNSAAKFKCDICGQEKTGNKYQSTVFEEQITRCEDCKNKQDQEHIALD